MDTATNKNIKYLTPKFLVMFVGVRTRACTQALHGAWEASSLPLLQDEYAMPKTLATVTERRSGGESTKSTWRHTKEDLSRRPRAVGPSCHPRGRHLLHLAPRARTFVLDTSSVKTTALHDCSCVPSRTDLPFWSRERPSCTRALYLFKVRNREERRLAT